jgi:hypothetical protein
MENRDKCPLCRRPLPPANPASEWHQKLNEELHYLSYNTTLTVDEYADRLLLITDAYISKLPNNLAGLTASSHPLNLTTSPVQIRPTHPTSLGFWRYNILDPAATLSRTNHHLGREQDGRRIDRSLQPLDASKKDLQTKAQHMGLVCFLLARHRLQAAISGDTKEWERVCRTELHARAALESALYGAQETEFYAEYKETYEEEQADVDDDVSDDADTGEGFVPSGDDGDIAETAEAGQVFLIGEAAEDEEGSAASTGYDFWDEWEYDSNSRTADMGWMDFELLYE